MRYKFTVHFETDNDFGFKFIPIGMDHYDETYSLSKTYNNCQKALADIKDICQFLSENAHGKDSVIDDMIYMLSNFLIQLDQADFNSTKIDIYNEMGGNQDGSYIEFSAIPHVLPFQIDLTDEEFLLIQNSTNSVSLEDVKTSILNLYIEKGNA